MRKGQIFVWYHFKCELPERLLCFFLFSYLTLTIGLIEDVQYARYNFLLPDLVNQLKNVHNFSSILIFIFCFVLYKYYD